MTLKDTIGNWWVTNARIKHGHPPAEPAASEPQASSSWKKTAIAAVASALIGGGVGAPLAAWWFSDSEPSASEPAEQSGSLYQYLEDNGFHVE